MFATKILSKELAPYNIRVICCTGVVSSKMADMMDKQVRERMVKKSILKRELKPSDEAKKILYLCSDEEKKVNGQILKIDRNL